MGMETAVSAMAAALAMGLSAFAAAWAESNIGTASVAAMAEDEKFFGKGLLMTVLPETLAIFGFVIALLILFGGA